MYKSGSLIKCHGHVGDADKLFILLWWVQVRSEERQVGIEASQQRLQAFHGNFFFFFSGEGLVGGLRCVWGGVEWESGDKKEQKKGAWCVRFLCLATAFLYKDVICSFLGGSFLFFFLVWYLQDSERQFGAAAAATVSQAILRSFWRAGDGRREKKKRIR